MHEYFSQCGELFFLHGAHFARWIKNNYIDSFHIIKSICHGAAGVARSSYQYSNAGYI